MAFKLRRDILQTFFAAQIETMPLPNFDHTSDNASRGSHDAETLVSGPKRVSGDAAKMGELKRSRHLHETGTEVILSSTTN
jgi:hypothetical protein